MKTIFLAALLAAATSPFAQAQAEALDAAKSHIANIMKMDFEKLEESYLAEIKLLPGHEFLKDVYGLAEAGARDKGATVAREKLIAAMNKSVEGRPGRPADMVAELLASITYAPVETGLGDVGIDSDGVATPDGKLHFSILEGDILLKASPPGTDDFLLLHLRKLEDKWRIVAEYLD